ncbi:hypothetical protein ACFO1B_31675 [Dactylosporangium siamense]|uniref:Lipoprotein n=1 Tax=Dactylosporangium siamense TaxID=685454 RepID=A0A919PUI8_9ACTN|nr:hypothetical protein [Dactylosporangium siamense]GIG48680.1 hypothetical protein Dsi01nite_067210 [Dactylosporangium siamense]
MRPARLPAAALVAALALGGLSACSPPSEPLLAVGRNPAGRPILHIQACPGGTVHGVYLRGPEPAPSAPPSAVTPAPGGTAPSTAGGASGSWPAGWAVGGPATGGAQGDIWRVANVSDTGQAWTIEIGTTPQGWQDTPIWGLPPGPPHLSSTGSYTAYVSSAQPDITWVDFTLDDLDGLKDGEVWTHKGHSLDERAMTLEAFREQATAAC